MALDAISTQKGGRRAEMLILCRAGMARIIKRWEGSRSASATVILAEGLVGSMHRSVLTGMQMLAPAPGPMKVFGTVADAVRWLAPHASHACGVQTNSDELLAGIDELVTRFHSRPAKAPTHEA